MKKYQTWYNKINGQLNTWRYWKNFKSSFDKLMVNKQLIPLGKLLPDEEPWQKGGNCIYRVINTEVKVFYLIDEKGDLFNV